MPTIGVVNATDALKAELRKLPDDASVRLVHPDVAKPIDVPARRARLLVDQGWTRPTPTGALPGVVVDPPEDDGVEPPEDDLPTTTESPED